MARTRTQIKTAVDNNTGRGTEKATLIETLCDEALKIGLTEHPFRDARSTPSDITVTEDATSVDISAITNLFEVLTVRVVEASGSKNYKLVMKDDVWWQEHVVNAEDNTKGWPVHGLKDGSNILLDRPADSNLELRLRVTTEQTFTNDATPCPIAVLDTFVVQYVTAYVFLSIENTDKFNFWHRLALGWKWSEGVVGGTLLHAISHDKKMAAETTELDPVTKPKTTGGIAVENLITGHDDYGETIWYH